MRETYRSGFARRAKMGGEEVEMEKSSGYEEMSRAAHEFSDAVDRFVKHVDRLEQIVPRPGLSDHDADSFALKAVHHAREEIGRETDAPAPDAEDVKKWVEMREKRRVAERPESR